MPCCSATRVTVLLAGLLAAGLALTCGYPDRQADTRSANTQPVVAQGKQEVPFSDDHSRREQGNGDIPAGTLVVVRLQRPVSAASSQSGDRLPAALDRALVANGHPVAPQGTRAMLRVIQVRRAERVDDGYLRLTLDSLSIGGREMPVRTSSIFAKGEQAGFPAGQELTFRLVRPLPRG